MIMAHLETGSPAKDNIELIVKKRPSPNTKGNTASTPYDFIFHEVLTDLKSQLNLFPITVIYCTSMQWIGYGYEMARRIMLDDFYAGEKTPHNARVVMFHSSMEKGSGQASAIHFYYNCCGFMHNFFGHSDFSGRNYRLRFSLTYRKC